MRKNKNLVVSKKKSVRILSKKPHQEHNHTNDNLLDVETYINNQLANAGAAELDKEIFSDMERMGIKSNGVVYPSDTEIPFKGTINMTPELEQSALAYRAALREMVLHQIG